MLLFVCFLVCRVVEEFHFERKRHPREAERNLIKLNFSQERNFDENRLSFDESFLNLRLQKMTERVLISSEPSLIRERSNIT